MIDHHKHHGLEQHKPEHVSPPRAQRDAHPHGQNGDRIWFVSWQPILLEVTLRVPLLGRPARGIRTLQGPSRTDRQVQPLV